jgi:hypothetical protein
MMVRVFDDFCELPLVGTLRDCVQTSFGWQGIDDDGRLHDVRYPDGSPPKIPPEEFIIQVIDGRVMGALRIIRTEGR